MCIIKIVKNANDAAAIVLSQALKASKQGTFGVGGCIINNETNEMVHSLHNNVLKPLKDGSGVFPYDPTAHGERQLIDWYYTNRNAKDLPDPKDLTIVTSLDPCAMCAGALLTAGFNVAVVAIDDFAGINYNASFSFESLPVSFREKAQKKFGYYGCKKTSAPETLARGYVGGEHVIFDGDSVDIKIHEGCADVFQKSVDTVRDDSSDSGLPPNNLKNPAELSDCSAIKQALQKVCKYALNEKFRQDEPRLPNYKLKSLLSKIKKEQPGAKNAVAFLDPFGNLVCCLPDTLYNSPIQTAFMNVTRAYAKTRFELTNNPETKDESTQYLTHPKYGTFVFLHAPDPNTPETIMLLGAYGSTMEGPIPCNFPANFQYYTPPENGDEWGLRKLIMNLPPFYTQMVVVAVQKIAKLFEQNSNIEMFHDRRIDDGKRVNDWRSPFSRDKARIIHGAGFRRLQGKTQVMGTGEGDFHRTRLTHTLEVNQIGLGLAKGLKKRSDIDHPELLQPFLKNIDPIVSAACYGHDLGHPPFGHGGERALHSKMKDHGGFEGNAQTIRLVTKLEKYHKFNGINPTRRVLLSLLKYPVNYEDYPEDKRKKTKPPKCYYNCDREIIDWCLEAFSPHDRKNFTILKKLKDKYKPAHMSFDASIMECADDIAYCTHDLEDIVARQLVSKDELMHKFENFFKVSPKIESKGNSLTIDDFQDLFKGGHERKRFIGHIVNLLMTSTEIVPTEEFDHPMFKYRMKISETLQEFAEFLKKEVTYKMVVNKPEIQMLERKGQRIVTELFDELKKEPSFLIPHWAEQSTIDSESRKISDYIAGMTDSYAIKIYHRLFSPGIGSSRDEL